MNPRSILAVAAAMLLAGCGGGSDSTSATTAQTDTVLSKPVQVASETTEWYVRLVAEDPARGLKTQSTQLGVVDDPEAVEKYSLAAMTPSSSSYLDIVFENPVGLPSDEYKSNLHAYQVGSADSWQFTVKTDDPQSEVLLTWHGLYVLEPYVDSAGETQYKEHRSVTDSLMQKMQVVDETTGEVFPAVSGSATPVFRIRMNGALTRTFRWELLTVDSEAAATSSASAVILRSATIPVQSTVVPSSRAFDLQTPPVLAETK